MASLNQSSVGRMRTTNREGHSAYRLDDKTKLVTMALTTMLGEPKFYGDNTDELIQLATKLCNDGEGEFVAKLAVWARTKGNLRSVSHALIAVVAHECSGSTFVRPAARAIASMRGDDGTEMIASYLALYPEASRHPHALQRGVKDALENTTPYALAKYQSREKQVKLRDVLRMTHPAPVRKDIDEAMGKAVAGTLPMPKSRETELSERGNTKEVWDELLAENKVGTFAMLRNLRSMLKVGADIDVVLDRLCDPEAIHRSRILPFRFYTAYRALKDDHLATTKVTRALDKAMLIACDNAERLPGRTAVMIDTSGSMGYNVSRKSQATCRDIAAVLGAMVVQISDDAWVCGFDIDAKLIPMTGTSVLADVAMVDDSGGATCMDAAFDLLMRSGVDVDRVVILSDNEVNRTTASWWSGRPGMRVIQESLDEYRRKVGHDVWCHAIDLEGYGTAQFIGPKVNIMAGWSDAVLRFVSMAEQGFGGIVDEVEKMEL